jgi:hemerythrin-like domain-containing protein
MEDSILTKLKTEHNELLFLLEDVEKSMTHNQRLDFFNKAKAAIIPHMQAEDETIYSKLKQEVADYHALDLVTHSNQEHHLLREFIQRLNLMDIDSTEWMSVFIEFEKTAQRHCSEEEKDLFTEAKEDFSREELIEMGNEFEEAKGHQP